MNLNELIKDFAKPLPEPIVLTGLSLNSQQLQPGEAFIALKGQASDGRAYIQQALASGASAVICEEKDLATFYPLPMKVIVPVKNLTGKLEHIVKRFYGDMSDLQIMGVTGTNGKTTTSFLLAQSLTRIGLPCAVLGTLGYGFVTDLQTSQLTTPDVISLFKYLNTIKEQKAQAVAMEVSSHGLAQRRVNAIEFCSALFTNLTQDHMDYHGSMEAYGRAKQKLFQFPSLKRAIVNADSPFAERMLSVLKRDVPAILYTVGTEPPRINDTLRTSLDTIFVKEAQLDQRGISAQVHTPWGEGTLRSPLLGQFNLSNLLGVLAELCLRDIKLDVALAALSTAVGAPGRMQRLGGVRTPQVIVDYAHTPDALENALKAARLHCRRRLWCVFGCGGDRDKDKRSKMGRIASLYADRVVITNDNPRSENPQQIIEDILQGIESSVTEHIIVEEDRQAAIEFAISHALAVDTILVAGKGHENYQIIADKKIPFSDVECVNALLKEDSNNEAVNYS